MADFRTKHVLILHGDLPAARTTASPAASSGLDQSTLRCPENTYSLAILDQSKRRCPKKLKNGNIVYKTKSAIYYYLYYGIVVTSDLVFFLSKPSLKIDRGYGASS